MQQGREGGEWGGGYSKTHRIGKKEGRDIAITSQGEREERGRDTGSAFGKRKGNRRSHL